MKTLAKAGTWMADGKTPWREEDRENENGTACAACIAAVLHSSR
jgi:hypothetical protein